MKVVTTREDHRIAALAALAIGVHIAEAALPSPVPGVKPGLANVIVIATLILFGWRAAVWVALLRVLAGSLLIGTFLSPTFVLSLAGAAGSLIALALGARLPGLSAVGYGLLGAQTHMACQFSVAYWLFIPHPGLLALLPPLMTAALVFGLVSGTIARMLIEPTTHPT